VRREEEKSSRLLMRDKRDTEIEEEYDRGKRASTLPLCYRREALSRGLAYRPDRKKRRGGKGEGYSQTVPLARNKAPFSAGENEVLNPRGRGEGRYSPAEVFKHVRKTYRRTATLRQKYSICCRGEGRWRRKSHSPTTNRASLPGKKGQKDLD